MRRYGDNLSGFRPIGAGAPAVTDAAASAAGSVVPEAQHRQNRMRTATEAFSDGFGAGPAYPPGFNVYGNGPSSVAVYGTQVSSASAASAAAADDRLSARARGKRRRVSVSPPELVLGYGGSDHVAEMAALHAQLATYEEDYKATSGELVKLRVAYDGLSKLYSELLTHGRTSTESYESLKKAYEQTLADLKQTQQSLDAAKQEPDRLAGEYARLQQAYEALNTQYAAAISELESLKVVATSYQMQLRDLTLAAHASASHQSADASVDTIESLKRQNAELQQMRGTLLGANIVFQQQHLKDQEALAALQSRCVDFEDRVRVTSLTNETLEKDNRRLRELEAGAADLRKQVVASEAGRASAVADAALVRAEKDELQAKLTAVKDNTSELEKQLKKAEDKSFKRPKPKMRARGVQVASQVASVATQAEMPHPLLVVAGLEKQLAEAVSEADIQKTLTSRAFTQLGKEREKMHDQVEALRDIHQEEIGIYEARLASIQGVAQEQKDLLGDYKRLHCQQTEVIDAQDKKMKRQTRVIEAQDKKIKQHAAEIARLKKALEAGGASIEQKEPGKRRPAMPSPDVEISDAGEASSNTRPQQEARVEIGGFAAAALFVSPDKEKQARTVNEWGRQMESGSFAL